MILEDVWNIDHPFVRAVASATEDAARAAAGWVDRDAAFDLSRSARSAMRDALDIAPFRAEIVVGDSFDDTQHSSPLKVGKHTGPKDDGNTPIHDVALDPTEGASFLVHGQTNALAAAVLAPAGTLFRPGPAFYMAKIAAPPALTGKIDPEAPVQDTLNILARELGKKVRDLTIFVLEKPRHRALIQAIEDAGARVASFPAGDIAGALMAMIPESGIDGMIGTGGASEGAISAAASRALGGVFMARLDPQLATEHVAVRDAGLDTRVWMAGDQLAASSNVIFAATGILSGILVDGVTFSTTGASANTLILTGADGARRYQTTYRPAGKSRASAETKGRNG